MFRLLKRTVVFLALLGAAYAGFRWGDRVFPPIERVLGLDAEVSSAEDMGPVPSAEMADATLDRFERFRAGGDEDRLALGGPELSSVLRYAVPGIIPPGVEQPTVELFDGRVRLSARVALDAFPRLPDLGKVVGILPDTVTIEMEGSLIPVDQAYLGLLIDHVEASHIPLPRRMVSDVLAGLGRQAPPSLPNDALSVPIPDGVRTVFVQRDSLILLAGS